VTAAAPAIVVMGVCGAGKTTVGRGLAAARGATLMEADDFHPPANVAKMSRGEALDDTDRAPWLAALAAEITRRRSQGEAVVATCSALKRRYRDVLRGDVEGAVVFAWLKISPEEAAARMAARRDHFMPASLVPSQFAALEEPADEPGVVILDAAAAPAAIVAEILAAIPTTTAAGTLTPRGCP